MTTGDAHQQLWQTALAELELQMPRVTFNKWLRGTQCVDVDDDTLVVAVKNNYAVEWLENRLSPVIERTLHRLSGNGTSARYVVEEPSLATPNSPLLTPNSPLLTPNSPLATELTTILRQVVDPATRALLQERIAALTGDPIAEDDDTPVPDFDCYGKGGGGYYPVSNYADQFWKPLLKRKKSFLVYTTLRALDKAPRGDWTTMTHVPIHDLCARVPCSRNTILGASLHGDPHPGALDILRAAGLADVDVRGAGRHTTYYISVRVKLPLLTPVQAARLPDDVQAAHTQWLVAHSIDPEPWVGYQF